jgi:hypothetical protein
MTCEKAFRLNNFRKIIKKNYSKSFENLPARFGIKYLHITYTWEKRKRHPHVET